MASLDASSNDSGFTFLARLSEDGQFEHVTYSRNVTVEIGSSKLKLLYEIALYTEQNDTNSACLPRPRGTTVLLSTFSVTGKTKV